MRVMVIGLLKGVTVEIDPRHLQDGRKQAGLEVSDRIILGVSGSAGVEAALSAHREFLMAETLATVWETGQAEPLFSDSRRLGDENWTIELRKAN